MKKLSREQKIKVLAKKIEDCLWSASYDGGRSLEEKSVELATMLVDMFDN